jgi:Zn-finger domain-containing protein
LEVGSGLEVVTGDLEKMLRMRYSGSISDVEIEVEAEETGKLKAKRDLKQVTEDMEKRLRMRYGENGIVEVENDAHERGVLRR